MEFIIPQIIIKEEQIEEKPIKESSDDAFEENQIHTEFVDVGSNDCTVNGI